MRRWLAFVLLLLLAAPAAAQTVDYRAASVSRGECSRMTRQIAHYAEVADRARQSDNEKWEEHTLRHIGRLSERRADLCPEFREKPFGQELAEMLRDAATIALKLYTMGML